MNLQQYRCENLAHAGISWFPDLVHRVTFTNTMLSKLVLFPLTGRRLWEVDAEIRLAETDKHARKYKKYPSFEDREIWQPSLQRPVWSGLTHLQQTNDERQIVVRSTVGPFRNPGRPMESSFKTCSLCWGVDLHTVMYLRVPVLYNSVSHFSLSLSLSLVDSWWLRKMTTDSHILAYIQFRNDMCPKLKIYVSELNSDSYKNSQYRNVSTDPLRIGSESLGIRGAHFGNHCFREFQVFTRIYVIHCSRVLRECARVCVFHCSGVLRDCTRIYVFHCSGVFRPWIHNVFMCLTALDFSLRASVFMCSSALETSRDALVFMCSSALESPGMHSCLCVPCDSHKEEPAAFPAAYNDWFYHVHCEVRTESVCAVHINFNLRRDKF